MVCTAKVCKSFELTKFLGDKVPFPNSQKRPETQYSWALAAPWVPRAKNSPNLGKIEDFGVFSTIADNDRNSQKTAKNLSERVVEDIWVEVDVAVLEEAVHGPVGNKALGRSGEDLPVGRDEPQFISEHQRLGDVMAGE